MSYMFNNLPITMLDISSFNTAKAKAFTHMFACCPNLRTIYASPNFENNEALHYNGVSSDTIALFINSTSLVGGAGTTYTSISNSDDKSYARIDGGPSNPGYFTLK